MDISKTDGNQVLDQLQLLLHRESHGSLSLKPMTRRAPIQELVQDFGFVIGLQTIYGIANIPQAFHGIARLHDGHSEVADHGRCTQHQRWCSAQFDSSALMATGVRSHLPLWSIFQPHTSTLGKPFISSRQGESLGSTAPSPRSHILHQSTLRRIVLIQVWVKLAGLQRNST